MKIDLATALKYGPAPSAAATLAVEGDGPFVDPVLLLAIGIGLLAGIMWRAARLHSDSSRWDEVSRDLISSGLSFLANGILALMIVQWLDWGVIPALGVGMLVGATGVKAIMWAQQEFFQWLGHRVRGSSDRD